MVTHRQLIQMIKSPLLSTGRDAGRSLKGNTVKQLRYTKHWQEDRAVAAGGAGNRIRRGRKVRTPQGSVPDNVRDVSVKAHGRPVPQKRNRLGYPFPVSSEPVEGHPGDARPKWARLAGSACRCDNSSAGVRVKWCGKSAPLRR